MYELCELPCTPLGRSNKAVQNQEKYDPVSDDTERAHTCMHGFPTHAVLTSTLADQSENNSHKHCMVEDCTIDILPIV